MRAVVTRAPKSAVHASLVILSLALVGLCFITASSPVSGSESESTASSTYRVNAPDLSQGAFEPAIFWFGEVTPTNNYADVRLWYYPDGLELMVNIIDRRLWYDKSPSASDISSWDSVTLLLNLDGNQGEGPSERAYRLTGQLNWFEPRSSWQAAARGNEVGWESIQLQFLTESGYRGAHNDNSDDKGWQLSYVIPFESLGLNGPPAIGTVWGLGVIVHDRDDDSGSTFHEQLWPKGMNPSIPNTWGQLHFGRAEYDSSDIFPLGVTTIQRGLNGAAVPDAHVGGGFSCGDGLDHWSGWGEANYAGTIQINIQNQWDVAEYPCFSKYYVTFPIDSVPAGKKIISAYLKMNMFGNAGGDEWGAAPDSHIQVSSVTGAWNESSLTWNNAPLASENVAGAWVFPDQAEEYREYSWDVTKAVASAYQAGQPVRLALYSTDGEMHSGKYFYSSDSNDWGGTVRPALKIVWGLSCGTSEDSCEPLYLPMIVP